MNQQELLEYLREHGPMTVPQIAEAFDTTPRDDALYMRMKKLHKYGLVEKIERDNDNTLWRATI